MKNQKVIKFGEDVEGYNTPVLNEREIRAAAGILFLFMFISLMQVLFKDDFLMIKHFIIFFLADLILRVFVNPKFSPTLITGRLIVSKQIPEYVAAAQKKFAWKIGIILSGLMLFLLVIINSYSVITGVTCLVCLAFLFFESAFGICLGCLFYGVFNKEKLQLCSGESCDVKEKHDIQKTSWMQIFVLAGFIACIALTIIFCNVHFSEKPGNLWQILKN